MIAWEQLLYHFIACPHTNTDSHRSLGKKLFMSLIEASHHYHVYKETFVQFEQCLGRGEEKAEIWTKPILSSCKPQQKPLLSNCWKEKCYRSSGQRIQPVVLPPQTRSITGPCIHRGQPPFQNSLSHLCLTTATCAFSRGNNSAQHVGDTFQPRDLLWK